MAAAGAGGNSSWKGMAAGLLAGGRWPQRGQTPVPAGSSQQQAGQTMPL